MLEDRLREATSSLSKTHRSVMSRAPSLRGDLIHLLSNMVPGSLPDSAVVYMVFDCLGIIAKSLGNVAGTQALNVEGRRSLITITYTELKLCMPLISGGEN